MSKKTRERFEAPTSPPPANAPIITMPVTIYRVKIGGIVNPQEYATPEEAWAWACGRSSDGTPPHATIVWPEKSTRRVY